MKDYDSYDHMKITAVEIPYKPPSNINSSLSSSSRRDKDSNVFIIIVLYI